MGFSFWKELELKTYHIYKRLYDISIMLYGSVVVKCKKNLHFEASIFFCLKLPNSLRKSIKKCNIRNVWVQQHNLWLFDINWGSFTVQMTKELVFWLNMIRVSKWSWFISFKVKITFTKWMTTIYRNFWSTLFSGFWG